MKSGLLFSAALITGGVFLSPASAAQARTVSEKTLPGRDIEVQVVQLESDPPGIVRQAPGGGRTLAPAMLYTPAKGANPLGPAVVMLNDGPGSNPLHRGQAARFAAERLAAQGYTVLSLYTGQERNFTSVPFDDVKWAVKGALDFLEHAGYEDFALAGQGYGALVALSYLKTLPDKSLDNGPEKRVKGLILINPLIETSKFPGLGDSKRYAERLAQAQRDMADGSGKYPGSLEPGRTTGLKTADWIAQGDFVQPAEGWLQYWGPDATARNHELLQDLPLSTLVIAGDQVSMSPVAAVRAMAAPTVDVQIVEGGSSDLSSVAVPVTDLIAKWLKAHDLGIRPRVKIGTTDVTTAGGVPLYGLVYEPEGGADPADPVIMLLHGRSADTLQSSTHWLGWRFAQAGYKTIAPQLQASGITGIQTRTMDDVETDVGHWMNAASAMGAKRVVLVGHSQGGIWMSNYVGDTQDKRVVGMIYIAPTSDAAEAQRRNRGEAAYAADNARAEKAIKEGRGLTEVLGVATAVAWYDLFGARSRTVHSDRVKEFSLPGLAIAGGLDPIMQDWFLDRFVKNYAGQLELLRYEGGTHGFRESKDRLVDDAVAWLGKTFP